MVIATGLAWLLGMVISKQDVNRSYTVSHVIDSNF